MTDRISGGRLAMALLVIAVGCKVNHEGVGETPSPAPSNEAKGATASQNERALGIMIPAGLPAADRLAAEHARDALLVACAATPINWNDFADVRLTTHDALGYQKDRFDWERTVTVALEYKEGLDRRRGGQRLTFDLGAGKRPGIVTGKAQGIQLCGFGGRARGVASNKPCDPDAAEDCILDVPELKVLDASRPSTVVESRRTAPAAWCFGHGFDPPPFWTCAPTEKKCKSARTAEKREQNGDYRVRTECSKTDSLYCFLAESGRTVCAPTAEACATSRKEWTNSGTATPCEVATAANLEASNARAK